MVFIEIDLDPKHTVLCVHLFREGVCVGGYLYTHYLTERATKLKLCVYFRGLGRYTADSCETQPFSL